MLASGIEALCVADAKADELGVLEIKVINALEVSDLFGCDLARFTGD